jgi:hypothetical protein
LRTALMALVAVFGLMALPTESRASPAVLHDPNVTAANLVLIAGGCGRGWEPRRYVDGYGRWRTRCVRSRYYPAPSRYYYPPPSRYYYGPPRYY